MHVISYKSTRVYYTLRVMYIMLQVEDQLHSSKAGSASLFRAAKRVRMLADHVKKSSLKK